MPLGVGIDEDQADDLVGVGGRVEPRDEAAQRVGRQDIGSGDLGRLQQRVQVGHHLRGGAGLGDGVAAADEVVLADAGDGPWAVVGTDAGELGHAGQHHRPRRIRVEQIVRPEAARRAIARLQHHGRTARRRGTPGRAGARRYRPARRSPRWPRRAMPPRGGGLGQGRDRQRQASGRSDTMTGIRCMGSLLLRLSVRARSGTGVACGIAQAIGAAATAPIALAGC